MLRRSESGVFYHPQSCESGQSFTANTNSAQAFQLNLPQPPGAFIWIQDYTFLLVIRCVYNRPFANGPFWWKCLFDLVSFSLYANEDPGWGFLSHFSNPVMLPSVLVRSNSQGRWIPYIGSLYIATNHSNLIARGLACEDGIKSN